MKVNEKNSEKKVVKKSFFTAKSLLLMSFTLFIGVCLAIHLVSTLNKTAKTVYANVIVQDKLTKTQTEIAEQNKEIDGLKSPAGAEAISRAEGMVKQGEVPVQIHFAAGKGAVENEEIADEPSLITWMNGLILLLVLLSIGTTVFLVKNKRINFNFHLSKQQIEEPDGLQRRVVK